MGYKHQKLQNRVKAKSTLKRLLPEAEKLLPELVGTSFEQSRVHEEMFACMAEERIAGIHIHDDPNGGWHADLTFEGMPESLPNMIGNPEGMALSTRRGAEHSAVSMLASLLAQLRERPKSRYGKTTSVEFQFGLATIDVPSSSVDAALYEYEKVAGQTDVSLESFAAMRLGQLGSQLGLPDSSEVVRSMDRMSQGRLETIAAIALAAGITRWPPDAPVSNRGLSH